jgi:hypothetical protein
MGKSLHDLVADMREVCPAVTSYYAPENLALYVTALLQSKSPLNSTYLSKDFGSQLLVRWDDLLKGTKRAVEFLEEERVFDAARLPTDVVVPVLSALWAVAPVGLDAEGRARTTLRKYLWRAFFTNRYEKTTSTRALADFNELKLLITGAGGSKPTVFDDAQHPLPEVPELLSAGWPKSTDRLSRAILALGLRRGGLDLADGSTATRANLTKREYHHLFPDAHLQRQEVPDEQIYLALNCALVTWRTNRNISDKEPERYLAERRDGTDLGEAELRTRLESHLIPFDEMVKGDYQDFLLARAELVAGVMKKLCASGASE